MIVKLSIEMATWLDTASYGKIHKAGCKDLKDGSDFESENTEAAVQQAAQDESGWTDEEFSYAPCARKLIKKGA